MARFRKRYFIYILTNPARSVLYTGVTNDVSVRLQQHRADAEGERKTFAGKYNCIHLLLVEELPGPWEAIEREKQIKGWSRGKKLNHIAQSNPEFRFLEDELCRW